MCSPFHKEFHEQTLRIWTDNSQVMPVYKVFWEDVATDGKIFHPVFGMMVCSVAFPNEGKGICWHFENKQCIDYPGYLTSTRKPGEPLSENEMEIENPWDWQIDKEDGSEPIPFHIEGLHSFMYLKDAILFAWHNAGMLYRPLVIVSGHIARKDFIAGVDCGGDLREYDTIYHAYGYVSHRVHIKTDSFMNPLVRIKPRVNTSCHQLVKILNSHNIDSEYFKANNPDRRKP